MKFIVGIGNPGTQYEGTRHNVGFLALDLAKKRGLEVKGAKLFKPDTFVNRTGEAVGNIARKGVESKDILVVCDDVNLAFGKIRLRESGGAGGHHGLESVIAALGSEDFPRLRIGVGNESVKPGEDLSGFVLGRFSKEEEGKLPDILNKAVAVCEAWIAGGISAASDVLSRP